MELDDLKCDWEKLNNHSEQQEKLTLQNIDQMKTNKYYSKISKITYPELAGGLVCLLAAGAIIVEFNRLDTAFFRLTGITTILILTTLPVISLISLKKFYFTNDLSKPYATALKQFALQNIRFQKFQQVNIFLCYLLLVVTIVLLGKFFNGKDITENKYFWTFSFSFGFIFLLFFSRWVTKHYKSSLMQAGELLKELENL